MEIHVQEDDRALMNKLVKAAAGDNSLSIVWNEKSLLWEIMATPDCEIKLTLCLDRTWWIFDYGEGDEDGD